MSMNFHNDLSADYAVCKFFCYAGGSCQDQGKRDQGALRIGFYKTVC